MTILQESLRKAAEIARIRLTPEESRRLVTEIEEVLLVFARIDRFQDPVSGSPVPAQRTMRKDRVQKCPYDPFSNARFIQNKKFQGPRLVE